MDKVCLNVERIIGDMQRLGITQRQLANSLGISAEGVSGVFRRSKNGEPIKITTARQYEKALFAEEGAYCLDPSDMPEQEQQPEKQADNKELIALTELMLDKLVQVLAIDQKVITELKNMNESMKELLMNVRGDTSTEKEYVRRIHDNVLKITEALK